MSQLCFFIAGSWDNGAISKQFKLLSRRFLARGHSVVYLIHGQELNIDEGNFHIRSFPSVRPTKFRDLIFLHKLVQEYQPDCMIANFGAVNVMNIVGWLNCVPFRVDWYHTMSAQMEADSLNTAWKKHLFNLRKRQIYRFATHIIANSESTRQDAVTTFAIKPLKTNVFYYSLEDPTSSIMGCTRDTNLIVCPGRLDPSKGHDVVIRALALLKPLFPEMKVHFVGAGRMLNAYQMLAEELKVSEQCSFVGIVPHQEMFRQMSSAAFTVVPSRSEAFGLVNIESMSVGTPVIASAVGGIPEIIRDGIDGFLVPPGDPSALAEKIRVLYSDHLLRETMGNNVRQRFLDVFELKKNIEYQVQWFEQLVRSHQ